MQLRNYLKLALALAFFPSLAAAQTALVALAPNMVAICPEPNCQIVAVNNPASVVTSFQFGAGTGLTWQPILTSLGTLPLTVDCGIACDPLQQIDYGTVKTLMGQQTTADWTVTWRNIGPTAIAVGATSVAPGATYTVDIPALTPPPPPPPVPPTVPQGLGISIANLTIVVGVDGWSNQAWFDATWNGTTWHCTYQRSNVQGAYGVSCIIGPPAPTTPTP